MVVIAISGKPLSGSSTIARKLAKRLGLRTFSAGNIYKSLAKAEERKKATESVNLFLSSEKGSSKSLHEMIDEMQENEAKKGNVVIEAKLGIHFSGKYADLKIWIEASDKKRAERLAKREGYSYKEAMDIIRNRDAIERSSFRKIYGIDIWGQKKEADLVIDSSDMTPNEIVDVIISALKEEHNR